MPDILDTFAQDVERAAQALAFGQSVEDVAGRLAEQQELSYEDAWLRVKAAEIWLRDQ